MMAPRPLPDPPWDCVHSGTWIIDVTEGHDKGSGSGSADDESGDINMTIHFNFVLGFLKSLFLATVFLSSFSLDFSLKGGTRTRSGPSPLRGTNTCEEKFIFLHSHPQHFFLLVWLFPIATDSIFLSRLSIFYYFQFTRLIILVKLNFQTSNEFPFSLLSKSNDITWKSALCDKYSTWTNVHTQSNQNLNWNFCETNGKMRAESEVDRERRERNAREMKRQSERKLSGNLNLRGFSPFAALKSLQVEGLARGFVRGLGLRSECPLYRSNQLQAIT